MLLCLALGVIFAVSLYASSQLRHVLNDLDHLLEVHGQTHRVHSTLLDLETRRHGDLATLAAPRLLSEPYRRGMEQLRTEFVHLSALLAGQPDQIVSLDKLRGLIDAKQAELAQAIQLANTQGADAALALVRDNQGKGLVALEAIESEIRARLDAARLRLFKQSEQYLAVLVATTALLLLALTIQIPREQALIARRKADEETARQDLERLVAHRTTELEEASQSLRLGNARLKAIFDAASEAILTIDADQTIIEANASAGQVFRCAVSDLIGAPLERLIPARFHEAHRRDVQAFGAQADLTRRMGRSREVTARRSDGEEFPIEAGISHFEVGGSRLYTVVLRDISAQRQAEIAQRENRAKLDAALASMNDAVFISDVRSHLLEFNDAFVSFHRFQSRDECRIPLDRYAQILDVFMADGTPAAVAQWPAQRALRGETASNVEHALRRRDTGQRWVGSYSFAPIRSGDGRIIGAVVNARDITDIKRTQAELARSHSMLQQLLANQNQIQENERKRIARELHDDLQQSLAAIRMDAIAIGDRVARGRSDAQPLLTRIDRLVAAALASTRRIVNDLRPEMLEELGLVEALQVLCVRHRDLTDAECHLEVLPDAQGAQLDESMIVTGLYRVAQEALNNVAKHAKATHVSVKLDCTQSDWVTLRVSDNGIGLEPGAPHSPGHFGLQGMTERVREMGGQFRIEGQACQGTMIEARVPIFASADRAISSLPRPTDHESPDFGAAQPVTHPPKHPGSGFLE